MGRAGFSHKQKKEDLKMNTPASTDKDLWVSWDEYNRLVERLALKVYESNWKFDMVLCLARGGVRPGDVISRIYDVPLAILSTWTSPST
jgi:hypoxanthine phosphoribosyltransferase